MLGRRIRDALMENLVNRQGFSWIWVHPTCYGTCPVRGSSGDLRHRGGLRRDISFPSRGASPLPRRVAQNGISSPSRSVRSGSAWSMARGVRLYHVHQEANPPTDYARKSDIRRAGRTTTFDCQILTGLSLTVLLTSYSHCYGQRSRSIVPFRLEPESQTSERIRRRHCPPFRLQSDRGLSFPYRRRAAPPGATAGREESGCALYRGGHHL
jgi:hypothetical protein